jgi:lipase maturation factor 1
VSSLDGEAREPHVGRLFRRLLAATFVIAWLSLGSQVRLLIGQRGLLPLASFVALLQDQHAGLGDAPTLLFWGASDAALLAGVALGLALSLLALVAPTRSARTDAMGRGALLASTLLYLSFTIAGQTFLSFQWDNLILECGIFAAFLDGRRRRAWVYVLYRLILFKLYFESGLAKCESHLGDWFDGSAMTFYYETAPIPTRLAWYAHALPVWWHHFESRATLVLELVLPAAVFVPWRRARLVVAALLTAFQIVNAATANYGFFCYLSVALHVFFLDDDDVARAGAWLRRKLHRAPRAAWTAPPEPGPRLAGARAAIAATVLAVFALVSLDEGMATFAWRIPSDELDTVRELYTPLRLINTYHLFAHITRERVEPTFETFDGATWTERDLWDKPGDPTRAPPLVAPHQPRVDFQLWFYGLSFRRGAPAYVHAIVDKLCRDPEALAPLFVRPLPDLARAVRVRFYRYRFTTPAERRATGAWWQRTLVDQTGPIHCR